MLRRHLRHLYLCLALAPVLVLRGQVPTIQSVKPLPDVASLYTTLLAHQEEIQNRVERYIYVSNRTTRQLDVQGKTLRIIKNESEHFLIQGTPFIRNLSRDGRALSAEESAAQEARLQKDLERLGKEVKPRDKKSSLWPTLLEILERAEFTSVRREFLGGQELLVLDFKPNKVNTNGSQSQDMLSSMTGEMIVDEDTLQLVRLEAHCTKDVQATVGGEKLVFGNNTGLEWEQTKLDGNTWMPFRYHYYHHRLQPKEERFDHILEYSNYRKFEVNDIKVERMRTNAEADNQTKSAPPPIPVGGIPTNRQPVTK